MSQKLTIASIEIKEGKSERGDWKNYIITAEDKTRVSTFDHQGSNLKVGDIIDAELEVKGKYINLVSWQVVGHAEPTPSPSPQEAMSKSDWSEKDKTTRKSIERQKSLEIAAELINLSGIEFKAHTIIALAQSFEYYLETGKIPPESPTVPSKEPTNDNLPETEKKPPDDELQGEKIGNADILWLKENLTTLRERKISAWSNANVASYLRSLTGMKVNTITEAISFLNTTQAQTFIKSVQEALKMSAP